MASQALPAGWPRDLPPPDHIDFERRAVGWLLDIGPVDVRAHDALRAWPPALGHLVVRHLESTTAGLRSAYADCRRTFTGTLSPEGLADVLAALESLGAAAAAREREAKLVVEALNGRRWAARL